MEASVSIIGGSGALGFGLAVRLGRAGIPIVIGSRAAERAQEAAARAASAVPGGSFEGLDNAAAAARSELVVLCVPFRSQSETLTNLKGILREGQLVVDTTVPLAAAVSGKATRMLGVWQGSAAEQAAEMVPDGVRVVSALHTVSAATLGDLDAQLGEDVLVCGNAQGRQAARHRARSSTSTGCAAWTAGGWRPRRIAESLTALLIGVNIRYKTHAGIRITGLD